MISKYLFNKLLLIFLFIAPLCGSSQSTCQSISAEARLVLDNKGNKINQIEIEMGSQSSKLIASIVGPSGFFKQNIKQTDALIDLKKGIYTVIFIGKLEEYNLCPKHVELIIQ